MAHIKHKISILLRVQPLNVIQLSKVMPTKSKIYFVVELVREEDARIVSGAPVSKIISKLEEITQVGSFTIRTKDCRVNLEGSIEYVKGPLAIAAEVFELKPSLRVLGVKRKGGDSGKFRNFCSQELMLGLQNLDEPHMPTIDESASASHLPFDSE